MHVNIFLFLSMRNHQPDVSSLIGCSSFKTWGLGQSACLYAGMTENGLGFPFFFRERDMPTEVKICPQLSESKIDIC